MVYLTTASVGQVVAWKCSAISEWDVERQKT